MEPAPPAVVGLDHVQLAMPAGGEEEARRFYAGLLGLVEVPKPGASAGRGGAWFLGGHAKVHLGVDPDFHPARKAHPALLVRDLGSLLERLAGADCEIRPAGPLDGRERAHVLDPFGNRIELIEAAPPDADRAGRGRAP